MKLTCLEVNLHGVFLSLHSGGATVRLTEDKRISIRNTAEYNSHRLLNDQQLKRRQKIHRQALDNRFPELSHVSFETSFILA